MISKESIKIYHKENWWLIFETSPNNNKEVKNMDMNTIEESFPDGLKDQLLGNEKVSYFSYISYKGGCLSSSSRDEYWIALTNKRVLYKAKVKEEDTNTFIEKDGVLPLDKISFIEVTDVKKSGCGSSQVYELRISSSGGTVRIPLPTKEKGYEIRKKYSEVVEKIENKEKQ